MKTERYGRTGPFWAGYVDDGYDWMGRVERNGWKALASWGKDNKEIGDWPYLVVAVNDGRPPFEVAAYAEGDVLLWRCDDMAEARHVLDAISADPRYVWRAAEEE